MSKPRTSVSCGAGRERYGSRGEELWFSVRRRVLTSRGVVETPHEVAVGLLVGALVRLQELEVAGGRYGAPEAETVLPTILLCLFRPFFSPV